ncbi:RidA family protein [Erythrobacter insulae]|uniref:RidA family protein n=1 Tax=Erythrobacter insulae TaxID=2584124 RepID=A0A547P950_9SPHN|nr:RidA family protein [Erythrobacter insulae]TRD10672.1 RidA family protein [Erythrobacter insulae]
MSDKVGMVSIEPDPLAPYFIAPARRVGDLLFLSGQAAIDEDGSIVGAKGEPGDFDAQLEQTFANIRRVLEAAGSSMANIAKVTIYLTDMAEFPKIIEARKAHFTPPYPADTTVQVTGLALPELLVEIDVIAAV